MNLKFFFLLVAVLGSVGPVLADGPATMAPVVSLLDGGDAASPATPPAMRWRVTKTQWTQSDERAFGEFVHALGTSDCGTMDECLKSSANI